MFGIWYLSISQNQIYLVFHIWSILTIRDNTGRNDLNSPEPVPDEHRPRREDAQGGVIVLGHELQVIRVFPFPLCATILKPNLDLENKHFSKNEYSHVTVYIYT